MEAVYKPVLIIEAKIKETTVTPLGHTRIIPHFTKGATNTELKIEIKTKEVQGDREAVRLYRNMEIARKRNIITWKLVLTFESKIKEDQGNRVVIQLYRNM